MKKSFLLFWILSAAVPAFGSAEGEIPSSDSKPEVSLSDPVAVPAAQEAQKMTKRRKVAKKISYVGGTSNPLGMTEEEQQIMQASNKKDLYRSIRQKPKNRHPASRS